MAAKSNSGQVRSVCAAMHTTRSRVRPIFSKIRCQRCSNDRSIYPSYDSSTAISCFSIFTSNQAFKKTLAAQSSQKTDPHPSSDIVIPSSPDKPPASLMGSERAVIPSSIPEEAAEDSFTWPSLDQSELEQLQHQGQCNDPLAQAIQETKALAHLPLDDEEEEDMPPPTESMFEEDAGESGTDENTIRPVQNTAKLCTLISKASALRDKNSIKLNAFQCMNSGTDRDNPRNPNARTIQILEDMCKYYDQMQDHWRTLAYRKCIATLKKQDVKIYTANQAGLLPYIGPRLANKVEEIVLTDRLRKLDSTRDDPLSAVLRLFTGIYGVGIVQANKWMQAGHRTLQDLQDHVMLTESQKVGVEHHDDFNSRIPRAEVEAHGAVVRDALAKLDSKFETVIMGSYRRGARDSGDIDLIITCPDTSMSVMRSVVFEKLVPYLYETGFLKASLTTPRGHDSTSTKWYGASCLPDSKVWRRLDLLLVPEEEMGAALIYFTGNDIFNRSIRLLARKKGMLLNQRGLYTDIKTGRGVEELEQRVLVEGRDEKKIFGILGVPWREPDERIC